MSKRYLINYKITVTRDSDEYKIEKELDFIFNEEIVNLKIIKRDIQKEIENDAMNNFGYVFGDFIKFHDAKIDIVINDIKSF